MCKASDVYKEIIKVYRRNLPRASRPVDRSWFLSEFPHLDRGVQWNRALYDMNVYQWNQPYSTGICLPVALYAQRLLAMYEPKLLALRCKTSRQFHHAVLKIYDKYYDSFHPEGVEDPSLLLYADVCYLTEDVQGVVNNFYVRGPVDFLAEKLFSAVDKKFDSL